MLGHHINGGQPKHWLGWGLKCAMRMKLHWIIKKKTSAFIGRWKFKEVPEGCAVNNCGWRMGIYQYFVE
jgi:hypothetical protein